MIISDKILTIKEIEGLIDSTEDIDDLLEIKKYLITEWNLSNINDRQLDLYYKLNNKCAESLDAIFNHYYPMN